MDFYPSNRVTISRMAFGNYLVSLTGQGRTVAIKRIQ
jgi:dihydroxyacetone kinase